MHARWPIVGFALCVTAACGGPGRSAKPPDRTPHPIPTCPATATIPDDVSTVTPSAAAPPTSVLKVGAAVAFAAPAGTRVHAVGSSDRPTASVVCQSSRGSGADRRAIILGLGPGYVQVAVVAPGSTAARRTLVTVTQ